MTAGPRVSWTGLHDRIRGRILDGTYGPGDKLPRDEDLAGEFGCARATVQRAMRQLSAEGVVERRRKGGTRVRAHPVTRATFDIPIARQEVELSGRTYGYRLVSRAIAETPRGVAAALGMDAPRRMLRVEALHLADGRPHVYEDRWICLETVPEIAEVDLQRQSANEWLVQNRPYSRCDLRFHALNAEPRLAGLLGARTGDALFAIERATWIDALPITAVKAIGAPGYQLLTQA